MPVICWQPADNLLEICWYPRGIRWLSTGNLLVPCWQYTGNTLAIRWQYAGNTLAIRWQYAGNTLAIRWRRAQRGTPQSPPKVAIASQLVQHQNPK
ncbi:hypothetical protein [Chitinophaga jiangningensis]|uniref:hypothetical protein n=1 Tax=Chitinophaga jiangningensis TaxID=1419482 RepID=UPI0011604794|nr:hypothetical protein [Chitinophaga jiangningensis]